jgi:hypothetical protein
MNHLTIENTSLPATSRKKVRALLLGDRIDISGLDHTDVLSTAPLAFRAGQDGVVTVFRYGVVVLLGLSSPEEDEVMRALRGRVITAASGPPHFITSSLKSAMCGRLRVGKSPSNPTQRRHQREYRSTEMPTSTAC